MKKHREGEEKRRRRGREVREKGLEPKRATENMDAKDAKVESKDGSLSAPPPVPCKDAITGAEPTQDAGIPSRSKHVTWQDKGTLFRY